MHHANGSDLVNTYMVNLYLLNQVAFQLVQVTEAKLNSIDVLIGMDIITAGDFCVSNYTGKTTFTFRVPSIRQTDYVAESRVAQSIQAKTSVPGRNDLCPCGSGKKYKRCHGLPQLGQLGH